MNSCLSMKRYIHILVGIICMATLTTLSGCRRWGMCKDETLPVTRQAYVGNKLRLDGFYYGDPGTDYKGVTRYNIFVLYANGVVCFPGCTELSNLEPYVSSLADGVALRSSKSCWGAFQIQDTTLSIGGWQPSNCSYPSVCYSGTIVNDTTFILTKTETRSGDMNGTKETNITYNFRHFTAKPDSTNDYVQ